MKHILTFIIALVLFGLCLIEKKSKEKAIGADSKLPSMALANLDEGIARAGSSKQ
ncbi:hypothetical protein CLV98_111146 [Dyadobacter jejuensis]|uniref:Uncharacterized protein n=1 Tax=Dyadobacter jejuensis TaxID=1082580 RepID=A0A316AGD9_9BACT|nr:hypothetical protein [Dyadobacter jejuensis]PWJ56652.1 hypothetical protein CLV98_111146 [Dyadobacter jejuensis]